jgi:hypothetical protein
LAWSACPQSRHAPFPFSVFRSPPTFDSSTHNTNFPPSVDSRLILCERVIFGHFCTFSALIYSVISLRRTRKYSAAIGFLALTAVRRRLHQLNLASECNMPYKSPVSEPIAVVGASCRFAGGVSSPSTLWQLLANPVDLTKEVPAQRFNIEVRLMNFDFFLSLLRKIVRCVCQPA